jgi:aminoglycoside 2''-phosphotransferase
MLTAVECLRIIEATYPDLRIQTYSFNNRGQNNDVLIVNEEIVFRFPRTSHGARQLRAEAAILSHLQDRVTLQVPNPLYLSLPEERPGGGRLGSAPSTAGGVGPGRVSLGGTLGEADSTPWWKTTSERNKGTLLTSQQRPIGRRARLGRRGRHGGERPAPPPEDRPGYRGPDGRFAWQRGQLDGRLPWEKEREERDRHRSRDHGERAGRVVSATPAAQRRYFVGYRWIPGEPLWRETLLTADDPRTVQSWADQLGTFLRELHQAPLTDTLSKLLPAYDTRARWADFYKRVETKVFPHMRADARREVAAQFETYVGNPANFGHPLTLVHGDFGPGNILFDSRAGRVTGVIDFGSGGLDDPAVDLAALIGPFGYGEAFIRRFGRTYPIPPDCLERARFYAGTFALQDAVFGLENGDAEAFAGGIASYR